MRTNYLRLGRGANPIKRGGKVMKRGQFQKTSTQAKSKKSKKWGELSIGEFLPRRHKRENLIKRGLGGEVRSGRLSVHYYFECSGP